MKKLLFLMLAMCAVSAVQAADAPKEEVQKMAVINCGKGDLPDATAGTISLTDEHLQGKETARMKVKGMWVYNMTKKGDWSKYNYLVFNAFLAGDKPYKGTIILGDKGSQKKWAQNNCGVPFTLKPGENKDVHIGIEGLNISFGDGRPLDMANMRIICLWAPDFKDAEVYFSNFYVVHEEE